MSLKLSKRREWVAQSEIRNMSIECDRVGGINMSQDEKDSEAWTKVEKWGDE
jgi:aminotransferase